MFDEAFILHAGYMEKFFRITSRIADRDDISEWSQVCVDLIDGKIGLEDVRDQSAKDKCLTKLLVRIAGCDRDSKTVDRAPPGSTLGLYSTSPRVLISQIVKNNGRIPANCPDFSSRDGVKEFLEKTTLVRDSMMKKQKKNWSFTFDQAADFLWMVRRTNPILFFLLVSREYELAEALYPWVVENIPGHVVHTANACFPNLKVSPLIAMRTIGSAQRFREFVLALEPYTELTSKKLKSLSVANDLAADVSGPHKKGTRSYLKSLGTSVFAVRQVLMLNCSRPELQPKGNQLWVIANPEKEVPLVDHMLLGHGNNGAKALLSNISSEINAAYPTGRPAGNGGKGSDTVERVEGAGGHRNFTLCSVFSLDLMQLGCRLVRQTSEDCNSVKNPTSVGIFAQAMLLEAGLNLPDLNGDPSAWAQRAKTEKDFGERANADFGSPSSMVDFGLRSWCRSNGAAKNWRALTEHNYGSTPDTEYFLIVRRYLHGFFPAIARKWKLDEASEVWAELAKCATAFSRDPIWIVLRNREAKMLDISAAAMRDAASKAKGNVPISEKMRAKKPKKHKIPDHAQFKTELRGFGQLLGS